MGNYLEACRMKKEFHVAVTGCDFAQGSREHPFRTISQAAKVAETGDKIIVHEGEYREWVKPEHSGYSNLSRITYEAAEGEKVVIKGSERIQSWEKLEGTMWKAVLPNTFFGEYNPYKETVSGDWMMYPDVYRHTGDVYLNGDSLYEANSIEEVKNPHKREGVAVVPWTRKFEKILHPEQTIYQWYSEVDHENTTIYANFQDA